jgi:hypothetical protein
MKRLLLCMLAAVLTLSAPYAANADNEYPNGIEGIKAATLPPPGFYYRMYNMFYQADELKDAHGESLDIGFDADVYANAHRFIWVTKTKVLGADIAADVIVPLMNKDIKIDAQGYDDDDFGFGDLIVEPLVLGWHGERYDATAGLGAFLPVGEYNAGDPVSPGSGMWTFMPSLGGTLYLDSGHAWSASVLSRYEIHTDKRDVDLTPGNDFHFEYGLGYNYAKILDLGISGYANWQVTSDSGSGRTSGDVKDHIVAVGPEVSVMIPQWLLMIKASTAWEVDGDDCPEGNTTTFTLTKIF